MGKIPWSWKWQPTPVFLPGKFHGQRSLVAIVHGVTKSRAWLSMHARMHTHMNVSVGKFSDTEVGSKRWRPPKLHQRPVCPQLPPFSCAAWSALTVDILLQGPETGVISKYKHAPRINQWVKSIWGPSSARCGAIVTVMNFRIYGPVFLLQLPA